MALSVSSSAKRLPSSPYIRAMHPKTEVKMNVVTVRKILAAGWWGQVKIHGHRAQFHIPRDPAVAINVYTRQGQPHKRALPTEIEHDLRRLLAPATAWNVVDGEWLKDRNEVYLFDFLKREGDVLSGLSYEERWQLLPRVYRSNYVRTLPVLRTVEECFSAYESEDPWVEGLVFKSRGTKGFLDSSIIRCRRD